MQTLVMRDLKARYRGSALGLLWALLHTTHGYLRTDLLSLHAERDGTICRVLILWAAALDLGFLLCPHKIASNCSILPRNFLTF
jgi:hypothetical protein